MPCCDEVLLALSFACFWPAMFWPFRSTAWSLWATACWTTNSTFEAINAAYDPESNMPLEKLSRVELALLADLLAGDFDENNLVDVVDLNAWQSSFGSLTGTTHFEGDSDGDGDNDGADMLNWQRQFGQTVATLQATSTNVPEPTSWGLFLVGFLASACVRQAVGTLGAEKRIFSATGR